MEGTNRHGAAKAESGAIEPRKQPAIIERDLHIGLARATVPLPKGEWNLANGRDARTDQDFKQQLEAGLSETQFP